MRQTNLVTVAGIDPGIDDLGLAYLTVQLEPLVLVKAWAGTLHACQTPKGDPLLQQMHSKRMVKLVAHQQAFRTFLLTVEPHAVAIELPFYNPKRPMAFSSLKDVVNMLRWELLQTAATTRYVEYDAAVNKTTFGVPGNSPDKTLMMEKVRALPGLQTVCTVDLTQLDEHAHDALAIAYTHITFSRLK